MKIHVPVVTLWLCAAALAMGMPAVRLPAVISDNMVLQANHADPIWGWATPGTKVRVTIAEQKKSTAVGADGHWQLALDPLPPGGPLALTVRSGVTTLTVSNILVGEVWLCAGQSNMEFPTQSATNGTEEVAQATFPKIRLFHVAITPALTPASDCIGEWVECSPTNVAKFSAVAYFFGRQLHQDLKTPVGLIAAALGGSQARAWISRPGLEQTPSLALYAKYLDEEVAKSTAMLPADWRSPDGKLLPARDDAAWAEPATSDAEWATVDLPHSWAGSTKFMATLWLRRNVAVPPTWTGHDLHLALGASDCPVTMYANGQVLQMAGAGPLVCQVPGRLVTGTNLLLAVKLCLNSYNKIGSLTGTSHMTLTAPDAQALALTGTWRYAYAYRGPWSLPQYEAAGLYNGMIAPLVPYSLRGVVWYQGESDAPFAQRYGTTFQAMITDWRRVWREDFPFLYVQLPNYGKALDNPVDDDGGWAGVREGQTAALQLPATGMAVTYDLGEPAQIHPPNKQAVARRLVLLAQVKAYQQKLVCAGPLYEGMAVEGDHIRIRFRDSGGGLITSDGKTVNHVAIAGADRHWVWAHAEIAGDTLLVSTSAVPNPVAVRYAWAGNPVGANLARRDGFLVAPFRTDSWPEPFTVVAAQVHDPRAGTWQDALPAVFGNPWPTLADMKLNNMFPGKAVKLTVTYRGHNLDFTSDGKDGLEINHEFLEHALTAPSPTP